MAGTSVENKRKNKSDGKVKHSLFSERNLKAKKADSSTNSILERYRSLFSDDTAIITNAQKGLQISAINDFTIISGKSQKNIAELIHTTAKTLQNYAGGSKRLPTLQSELLLKLFTLYNKGLEIFDGVESFNSWLESPSFGLFNVIPETLLTTSTGINFVMDELIRIEYGDFA